MEVDQVAQLIAQFSYIAVFALLIASGVGAPVSEELILIAGGVAIAKGGGSLPLMIAIAVVGTLSGDFILYSIGRKLGPRAMTSKRFGKVLTPERVAKVEGYFLKYGAFTIFGAGFVAGLRAPTFLISGVIGYPKRKFLLADAACVVLFVPAVTWLGYRFGLSILDNVQSALTWALIIIVALVSMALLKRFIASRMAPKTS